MKKLLILSLIGMLINPFSVFAQVLTEDQKKQAQEDVDSAKKTTSEAVYENLGSVSTPDQQKSAFNKLFAGLEIVLDETEEEVKGSKNLTSEQKQLLLNALGKVSINLDNCESKISASKTQEELNSAYQQCVAQVKQSINEFMNAVYDVMLLALDEYLKVSNTFLTSTRTSVKLFGTCSAITEDDLLDINKNLDLAKEETLKKDASEKTGLWYDLNKHNEYMKTQEYNRANVIKAADLTARLSAVMSLIYEDYEDLYAVYEENCGNIPGELKTPEDVEKAIEDAINEQIPQ